MVTEAKQTTTRTKVHLIAFSSIASVIHQRFTCSRAGALTLLEPWIWLPQDSFCGRSGRTRFPVWVCCGDCPYQCSTFLEEGAEEVKSGIAPNGQSKQRRVPSDGES